MSNARLVAIRLDARRAGIRRRSVVEYVVTRRGLEPRRIGRSRRDGGWRDPDPTRARPGIGLGLPASAAGRAGAGASARGRRRRGPGRHDAAGYRVLETAGAPVYYFPPERRPDGSPGGRVRTTRSASGRATPRTTGTRRGGRVIENVAWSYPDPKPGYEAIRDYLAFYAGRVDEAWVGDERATPAAGPLLRRLGHVTDRRADQGRAGLGRLVGRGPPRGGRDALSRRSARPGC